MPKQKIKEKSKAAIIGFIFSLTMLLLTIIFPLSVDNRVDAYSLIFSIIFLLLLCVLFFNANLVLSKIRRKIQEGRDLAIASLCINIFSILLLPLLSFTICC